MDWWKTFFEPQFYGSTLENFPPERTKSEVDFVLSALKLRKRAAVLDLCCGIGRHALEIARRGYRVTGLDYTPEYLETARQKAKDAGLRIEFVRGDMRKIPWENHFDAVLNLFTSFGFFEKDSDNFKVLTAVSRCLKPGGRFVLDTMNRDWIVRNFSETRWSEIGDSLVLQKESFDAQEDLAVSRWTWIRNGKKSEAESRVKLYPYSTIKREIERRGMRIIDSFGDFEGNKFSMISRRMILLIEKKK